MFQPGLPRRRSCRARLVGRSACRRAERRAGRSHRGPFRGATHDHRRAHRNSGRFLRPIHDAGDIGRRECRFYPHDPRQFRSLRACPYGKNGGDCQKLHFLLLVIDTPRRLDKPLGLDLGDRAFRIREGIHVEVKEAEILDDVLARRIREIIDDPVRLQRMSKNSARLSSHNAANAVVETMERYAAT